MWHVKLTIIEIVIGALGTDTKGLLKALEDVEIRGGVETILSTELQSLTRILRRVLGTCCFSNFREKPSANADVKKSQEIKMLIQI